MATRKKAVAAADAESSAAVTKDSEGKGPSFEEAMERLSVIVEDLEGGELSLEESLKRFEEGVRLARQSQARLDTAEAKVEELLGFESDGSAITEDM